MSKDDLLVQLKKDFSAADEEKCPAVSREKLKLFAGNGSVLPGDVNLALKEALARGAEGIYLDLTGGLYEEIPEDTDDLFQSIDLRRYPVHIYAGATAVPGIALLKLHSLNCHEDSRKYQGCFACDPLGEYALSGKLPADLDCYLNQLAAAIRWQVLNLPKIKCIAVRGSVYHNGGAKADLELACVMGAVLEYIDGLLARDLDINDIAAKITVELAAGGDMLTNIAKIRGAEKLWAKIIAAYGGNEISSQCHITVINSRFWQNPQSIADNQQLRLITYLSALWGRAAAVYFYDDKAENQIFPASSLVLPALSRDLPADFLADSVYLQRLTDNIVQSAWQYLRKIVENDGFLESLMDGMPQEDIENQLDEQTDANPLGVHTAGPVLEVSPHRHQAAGEGVRRQRAFVMEQHQRNVDDQVVKDNLSRVDGCICTTMAAFSSGAAVTQIMKKLNQGHLPPAAALAVHSVTE